MDTVKYGSVVKPKTERNVQDRFGDCKLVTVHGVY